MKILHISFVAYSLSYHDTILFKSTLSYVKYYKEFTECF